MAEELYDRLNYLREQLAELRERVEQTGSQVEHLQREQAANRALLERIAEQQGIDVDEVLETVSNQTAPGQRQHGRQQEQRGGQGQRQHGGQGQPGQRQGVQGQRDQGQQGQDQGFTSQSSFDTTSGGDDRSPGN